MLFNSLHFLIFLPIVVYLYFLLPLKARRVFLLLASYYFYMCWKPEYVILILFSTAMDYYLGLRIDAVKERKKKRGYLTLSLFCNLGFLFAFKYFNFFSESARFLFAKFNVFHDFPVFHVLLPVGISFYIFQSLSYTIDVYRNEKSAEKDFTLFALYVAYFPQLVAGPIERSTHLLPQLSKVHEFSWERVKIGLRLMLWGFFKKIVLADNLAVIVDQSYHAPQASSGAALLLATYCFAFQIYYDFSGYTDIARGASKIFGIDLMQNFRQPYFSRSIVEFWQRWHISLSTWFRDYLYLPLGGARVAPFRWVSNILVVFLLSGLWHGANWTFVVWGALHGAAYLFVKATHSKRKKLMEAVFLDRFLIVRRIINMALVFNFVSFAWIFFRAKSVTDAGIVISKIYQSIVSCDLWANLSQQSFDMIIWIGLIIFIEFGQKIEEKVSFGHDAPVRLPIFLRWSIYYLAFFVILTLGNFHSQQFIYFQF